MSANPENSPNVFQRVKRFVMEKPLAAAGTTIMVATMINVLALALKAGGEVTSQLQQSGVTSNGSFGGGEAYANLSATLLDQLYKTKYQQEVATGVAGLIGGTVLVLSELPVGYLRSRRRHPNLPTGLVV